jgi:TonB family protein
LAEWGVPGGVSDPFRANSFLDVDRGINENAQNAIRHRRAGSQADRLDQARIIVLDVADPRRATRATCWYLANGCITVVKGIIPYSNDEAKKFSAAILDVLSLLQWSRPVESRRPYAVFGTAQSWFFQVDCTQWQLSSNQCQEMLNNLLGLTKAVYRGDNRALKPPALTLLASTISLEIPYLPEPDAPSTPKPVLGQTPTRDQYLAYLVGLARQHLDLLPMSLVGGRRGETTVRVLVLKDGTISHTEIASSSGYPDIDKRIEQMVVACNRFPPLPEWYKGDSVPLELHFKFPEALSQ